MSPAKGLGLTSLLTGLVLAVAANGAGVGDIEACYACAANFTAHTFDGSVDLSDGVGFAIVNTSGTAITNGVLQILVGGDNATADSFNVGTIGAGATVYVVPGISDDGQSGHTFFAVTSVARDTSDVGPLADSVPFQFTGQQGSTPVSTGIFTPGGSVRASNDAGVSSMNFLGGPSDGCDDCFGPAIVAHITTGGPATTPAPSSLPLLGIGLAGLAAWLFARRRWA